jgi:type IV secretory pathway VirB4 component
MAKPATGATQDFVPIRDIKDGVVILKSGQLCRVLLASSVNFALKSLDEQKAILFQFQNFLNTLDFTLQIYVQSRRLNIEPYIETLEARQGIQDNDLMKIQLREYIEFIRTFTKQVDVMNKSFFLVIPYTAPKVDIGRSFTSLLSQGVKSLGDTSFEEQRLQLEQRQAVVEQGLSRIGVRTIPLQTDELVELFYHLYNPGDIAGNAPTVQ